MIIIPKYMYDIHTSIAIRKIGTAGTLTLGRTRRGRRYRSPLPQRGLRGYNPGKS